MIYYTGGISSLIRAVIYVFSKKVVSGNYGQLLRASDIFGRDYQSSRKSYLNNLLGLNNLIEGTNNNNLLNHQKAPPNGRI